MRDTHSLRKLLFIFALTACSSATPGTGDDDDTTGPDAGMVEPDPDATLAVRDDGFTVIDGVRWTAGASPTITGTVGDATTEVEVRLGGTVLGRASVSGTAWSFDVPPGVLGIAPAELTFVGRIGDGAQVVVKQTYAADATPPALDVLSSKVSDERNDTITLAADGAITAQVHAVPVIDLAAGGCPDVFKHAYLMDPGDSNPIRWQLTATDDGIGIDPASAQVRFGLDGGELGAPRPITGTKSGATTTFQVDALRTATPFIATTEGKLVMQLSVKDKLGREAQFERCWTNHPLAVPLRIDGVHQAIGHRFAMLSNILASGPFFNLANGMINVDSDGLGIMDYELFNGTEEPAIVTINALRPQLTTRRDYIRRTVKFDTTDLTGSGVINCGLQPSKCDGPVNPPPIANAGSTLVEDPERWTVRVFRFAADGTDEEVPCSTCNFAAGVFTFTLPGKASATDPGVHYKVMTGVRELQHLMPTGAPGDVDFTPITDFQITPGLQATGRFSSTTRTSCTRFIFNPQGQEFCNQTSKFRDYRALSLIDVRISGVVSNTISTSPATGVAARVVTTRFIPSNIGFAYSFSQANFPPHAP